MIKKFHQGWKEIQEKLKKTEGIKFGRRFCDGCGEEIGDDEEFTTRQYGPDDYVVYCRRCIDY